MKILKIKRPLFENIVKNCLSVHWSLNSHGNENIGIRFSSIHIKECLELTNINGVSMHQLVHRPLFCVISLMCHQLGNTKLKLN